MKIKKLLTRMLLVTAGLCMGVSAWADWTTTNYNFTSMGDATITLSSTTSGYANRTQCYLPNETIGTDADKMNSKIGFTKANETVSSSGLYFPADAYINIQGLQEGDIFIATFSGANFKAVNHVSGNYTNTEISSNGSQLDVWANLTSNEKYFAMSTTSLGFQTKAYLKITNITIKHNDSENYLALFRLWKTSVTSYNSAEESGVKTSLGDAISAAKTILHNESATESDYISTIADLKRANELLTARNGNSTFSITSAPKGGDKVFSVYGITMTYGGTSEETWSHALSQNTRGWINQGGATLSGNLPTGRTFLKFEPVIDGTLTISSYLFTDATTFHVYLSDGTTILEDKTCPKKGQDGSLGGNGTYAITFSTELRAGKTYYVYYSKYTSGGTEQSYVSGFWGFTYTPSNNIVGDLDRSSGYRTVFGDDIVLTEGNSKKITLQNHGSSAYVGYNWLLDITHNASLVTTLRADWYAFDKGSFIYGYTYSTDGGITANNINVWSTYNSDMEDSEVELTASYTGGTLYVIGTMTKDNKIYYYNYSYGTGLSGDITLKLSVEKAWLEVKSIEDASVVTTPVHPTNVAVTMGTNGYATYANNVYPLDLTSAKAYKAAVDGSKVKFTLFGQAVPAGTGMLVEGTASGTVNLPIADASTAVAGNEFLVNASGAVFDAESGYNYFALIKDSNPLTFGTFAPSTLAFPANKTYLKVAASAGARLLAVFGDDETTGISQMESGKLNIENAVYNLNGQRVAQPTKGLYIVGGKKVMMK